MGQIVTRASNDPGVRVIVLSSTTDKTFTGGLDCELLFVHRIRREGTESSQNAVTDGGALSDPRYSDPARKAFALHEHVIVSQHPLCSTDLKLI